MRTHAKNNAIRIDLQILLRSETGICMYMRNEKESLQKRKRQKIMSFICQCHFFALKRFIHMFMFMEYAKCFIFYFGIKGNKNFDVKTSEHIFFNSRIKMQNS